MMKILARREERDLQKLERRSLMLTQLRIYTINRGALDSFAIEWKEKIKPIRLKLGFQILGAWTVQETNQFVWLMGYEGPQDWDALDQAYFQSDERRALQPDPARHIARVEQYFVAAVT